MKTNKLYPRLSFSGVAGLVVLPVVLISTWVSGCNQNQEQTIAFTNVNLVPMTSETAIKDQTVLVSGNPLRNITTIREPLGVMADGRWYSAEQLFQLIEIPRH